MLSFFKKEKIITKVATPKGMDKVRSASELLAQHEKLLGHIRRLSAASSHGFDKYYLPVIERFVEAIQLMPGPKSGGFEKTGGMIEKALLLVIESLKIRQGYLLPVGSTAEEIARTKELWTYVAFVGALVHRMGHGLYEFEMIFFNGQGEQREGRYWPVITPIDKEFCFYRFRKLENIHSKSERYLPILLLRSLLGMESFNWILTNDKTLEELLSFMVGGSLDDKNALSEIIRKAHSYLQENGMETPKLEGVEPVETKADENKETELSSVDDEQTVIKDTEQSFGAFDTANQVNEPMLEEKVMPGLLTPEMEKKGDQHPKEEPIIQTERPKIEHLKKKQPNKQKIKKTEQPKAAVLPNVASQPPKDNDWLSGPPQEFLNKLVHDINTKAISSDMASLSKGIISIEYPLGLKRYTQTPADMKTKLQSTIFWVGEDKGGLERKKRYIRLRLKK